MVHICNHLISFGALYDRFVRKEVLVIYRKLKIDKRLKRLFVLYFFFGIKIVSYFKSCLFGQELS